jgi:putative DNA primase/helicase
MTKKKRKVGLDDHLKDQGAGSIEELETMKPEFRPEFRLDEQKGVYFLPVDADGNGKDEQWICSPLEITVKTRDTSGENWGYLLTFTDCDGKIKSWTLPAEMLKGSGEDMRGVLLSKGLRITSNFHARQKLVTYIQITEPKNKRRAICTDRTGWYGRKLFVLPEQTIGEQKGEVVLFQSTAVEALSPFSEKGTVEQWRHKVAAKCAGNSRLIFAVSCACAGPLLNLANTESGGINFVGATSTGKTTALDVAASFWGNPDTYKQSWRATDNGLEGIAAIFNDALLPLDEMGQIDARKVGEIAYMLANGQGKNRANKSGAARGKKSWRLLFLSSGENGLVEHMKTAGLSAKAGQEIRLVDVPADAGAGMGLFENIHGAESPSRFADMLRQVSRDYYGAAGVAYLEKIVASLDSLPKHIEGYRREFNREYVPGKATGQIERAAGRFSLVAAAGELATAYGLTGWETGAALWAAGQCFKAWLDSWGPGAKEEQRLLEKVREFFEKHGESRFTPLCGEDEEDRPFFYSTTREKVYHDRATINRAGFRQEQAGGGTEYFVLPEAFKEICSGFSPKWAAKVLADKGIISCDGQGKTSQSRNLPGMRKTRCYYFTAGLWNTEPEHLEHLGKTGCSESVLLEMEELRQVGCVGTPGTRGTPENINPTVLEAFET